MIGQDKILNKINEITFDTMPHSLMLIGPSGSGKHSICQIICDKLSLQLVDISDLINHDTVVELNQIQTPHMYLINGDIITLREESVILKLLEEPNALTFLVIYCTSKNKMLNTIINRCVTWELNPYSEIQLQTMFPGLNPVLYKITKTPGKLLEWQHEPLDNIIQLCENIINKISVAGIANTLTIPLKLNLSGNGGYDVELFLYVLIYQIKQKICIDSNKQWYTMYILTNELLNNIYIPHIDLTKLFENYLCKLKLMFIE